MYSTVDVLIRNADYPSAIREHIHISMLGEKWSDFTVYEQDRLISNAQIYCDNALHHFLAERKAMEQEFC